MRAYMSLPNFERVKKYYPLKLYFTLCVFFSSFPSLAIPVFNVAKIWGVTPKTSAGFHSHRFAFAFHLTFDEHSARFYYLLTLHLTARWWCCKVLKILPPNSCNFVRQQSIGTRRDTCSRLSPEDERRVACVRGGRKKIWGIVVQGQQWIEKKTSTPQVEWGKQNIAYACCSRDTVQLMVKQYDSEATATERQNKTHQQLLLNNT